jgi:hypothetical protein
VARLTNGQIAIPTKRGSPSSRRGLHLVVEQFSQVGWVEELRQGQAAGRGGRRVVLIWPTVLSAVYHIELAMDPSGQLCQVLPRLHSPQGNRHNARAIGGSTHRTRCRRDRP